jgi:hypothetical protein
LYQSDATGSTRQRFSIPVAGPAWPSWSPDGSMLAFADVRAGTGYGQNLFTMPSDGSGVHQITGFTDATNGFPFGALWLPAIHGLLGAGTLGNVNGLWIIPLNADRTACEGTPVRLPTTPGDLIDFAGSIRVGVAPPALFVRHDPGEVTLYWDAGAHGYVLESASAIQPFTEWLPIRGPYALNGGFNEVRIPDAGLSASAYFRLHRP